MKILKLFRKIIWALGEILRVPGSIFELFITYMPGNTGILIRYLYYKKRLKYLGRNAIIDIGVRIDNPKYVSIGENTWINKYVLLTAGPFTPRNETIIHKSNPKYQNDVGELVIGSNCHIGPFCNIQAHAGLSIGDNSSLSSGVKIYSVSHHHFNPNDPSNREIFRGGRTKPETQCLIVGPVVIEYNVGVGFDSIVLSGATIEKESFVHPFSIVRTKIPENSIAAGNPAERIKERFE